MPTIDHCKAVTRPEVVGSGRPLPYCLPRQRTVRRQHSPAADAWARLRRTAQRGRHGGAAFNCPRRSAWCATIDANALAATGEGPPRADALAADRAWPARFGHSDPCAGRQKGTIFPRSIAVARFCQTHRRHRGPSARRLDELLPWNWWWSVHILCRPR